MYCFRHFYEYISCVIGKQIHLFFVSIFYFLNSKVSVFGNYKYIMISNHRFFVRIKFIVESEYSGP
jgi:hypothetical protein